MGVSNRGHETQPPSDVTSRADDGTVDSARNLHVRKNRTGFFKSISVPNMLNRSVRAAVR